MTPSHNKNELFIFNMWRFFTIFMMSSILSVNVLIMIMTSSRVLFLISLFYTLFWATSFFVIEGQLKKEREMIEGHD